MLLILRLILRLIIAIVVIINNGFWMIFLAKLLIVYYIFLCRKNRLIIPNTHLLFFSRLPGNLTKEVNLDNRHCFFGNNKP